MQLRFSFGEWGERDVHTNGENGSSAGGSEAEPTGRYVLRHAVAVVRADADGSKVHVVEQKTAGLAAGLPHVVGADFPGGVWREWHESIT